MNELTLVNKNSAYFVDSRDAAKLLELRHDRLLRDIHDCKKALVKAGVPDYAVDTFFVESSYPDENGEKHFCYLLTQMGADVVSGRMGAAKSAVFTPIYKAMYGMVAVQERAETQSYLRLCERNKTARLIVSELKAADVAPESIALTLKHLYEPIGVTLTLVGMPGKHVNTVSDIAYICGILTQNGKPHSRATNAIISMLNIDNKHKSAAQRKNGSVGIQYDDYVINAVDLWVENNNYPPEIKCGSMTYKVKYQEWEGME